MITFSQKAKITTVNPHSLASLSHLVILLVFSAPSFLILLTPWSPNFTLKEVKKDPLVRKSEEFIKKSDSKDFGQVS